MIINVWGSFLGLNVYLSGGNDNLALHRAPPGFAPAASQRLDHIRLHCSHAGPGGCLARLSRGNGVVIVKPPKTHRDGARSFYCRDPDGNVVQIIYHPPISSK